MDGFMMDDNYGQLIAQNQEMQDQLMQQQMMYQQMQDQYLYNQQQSQQVLMSQMGRLERMSYDRYGIPNITRPVAMAMLEQYIYNTTGCVAQIITTINETPNVLRHCCIHNGISFLMRFDFPIVTPKIQLDIPFYFCNSCGRVFVYKDFM